MTRHELYRATKLGQFQATLPLAANDPAGKWTGHVQTRSVKHRETATTFHYTPPVRRRALAGATPRAVYFGNDRDNIFRFARLHHDVTIVKGTALSTTAAAQRLVEVLEPWGVSAR